MTGFIDSIPWEMEEAAVMDGCGIYRIVFQIITPMLKPSIATVAIMTFLNNWNEFIMASTYLSTPKWKTLPFSVLEFTGQYSSNYAVQFAVMHSRRHRQSLCIFCSTSTSPRALRWAR